MKSQSVDYIVEEKLTWLVQKSSHLNNQLHSDFKLLDNDDDSRPMITHTNDKNMKVFLQVRNTYKYSDKLVEKRIRIKNLQADLKAAEEKAVRENKAELFKVDYSVVFKGQSFQGVWSFPNPFLLFTLLSQLIMPIITNDNYKGCSLEEFVDFNLDELFLLDTIINELKNHRTPKIVGDDYDTLNIIQAKVLIRTQQP